MKKIILNFGNEQMAVPSSALFNGAISDTALVSIWYHC